jgi:signal transduction histidine kinase
MREVLFRHRLEQHRLGVTSSEYQVTPNLRLQVIDTKTNAGGIVSVFRDVTSTERELRRARQAAQEAEVAQAQFVEAMARRVSQPANNVLGMVDMLEQSDIETGPRRYVAWARRSASEILATVDEVLQTSRSRSAALPRDAGAFEVVSLVHAALCQAGIQSRGRRVEFRVQCSLPEPLRGDAEHVRTAMRCAAQALLDLVACEQVFIDVSHEVLSRTQIRLVARFKPLDIDGHAPRIRPETELPFSIAGSEVLRTARTLADAMEGGVYIEENKGTVDAVRLELVVDSAVAV